jgi:hypothetical protein
VVKAMFTKGLMDDTKFRATSYAFNEELQGQPARETRRTILCGPFALTFAQFAVHLQLRKIDKCK